MPTNATGAAVTAPTQGDTSSLPSHGCPRHLAQLRRAEAAYLAGLVALNERRIVRGRRARAAVAQAIAECGARAEGAL